MISYDKFSYNHCEKIFDSKNKLHNYIRNHECATTSSFVAKSISFYKFNLSALVFVETSTLLSVYRFVSPSSSIYKPYKKPYLTIADLYIRYVSLSKSQTRNKITRIMIVFLIMFMQNLYKKFYDKKKWVILTLSKILDFSIKQHTTR